MQLVVNKMYPWVSLTDPEVHGEGNHLQHRLDCIHRYSGKFQTATGDKVDHIWHGQHWTEWDSCSVDVDFVLHEIRLPWVGLDS